MTDITLVDLPYVDGPPDAGQSRIEWIKNDEEITGADTKYGSEGVMNRPIVEVQRNVEALDVNIKTIASSLNTANKDIKVIQGILDVSGDVDALAQIGQNTQDIDVIKVTVQTHASELNDLNEHIDANTDDIGVYNQETDSVYRTVRNDLLWIKNELGQYTGQDINGVPTPGNDSTGMKRRIMTNSSVIVDHGVRLTDLETKFADSDVGSLTSEVEHLREEMGPRTSFTTPVFSRLSGIDLTLSRQNADLDGIKQSIGYPNTTSIITTTNANSSAINDINLELNQSGGIKPRLTTVETAIGTDDLPTTIQGRIKLNTDAIGALNTVVGSDSSSGLRFNVSWLNNVVGVDASGGKPEPDGSLLYRTRALEGSIGEMSNDVQNIQTDVGTNTTGIKGSVNTLNTLINGTNPNGSTVEERGILPTVKSHDTTINGLTSRIATLETDLAAAEAEIQTLKEAGYIEDAPSDGKFYVRKDGAWVELPTA
ncbi:fibritin neck whiskers protein [Escherichia phage F2]|uniref:Fibritin neck whiskers protein n=1 Tax=Escherichia phage F2 TaxID=2696339 RepID=A0A6G6XHG6_9CAUD|nr:fibritin neck whisker [Escherichia phage F2]QIG57552.1 fibritin neck whiskers protein [Escherichia phage F2]